LCLVPLCFIQRESKRSYIGYLCTTIWQLNPFHMPTSFRQFNFSAWRYTKYWHGIALHDIARSFNNHMVLITWDGMRTVHADTSEQPCLRMTERINECIFHTIGNGMGVCRFVVASAIRFCFSIGVWTYVCVVVGAACYDATRRDTTRHDATPRDATRRHATRSLSTRDPYPIPPYPIPSHLIPSHPISSHLIPSHPIPSHPIPSHPQGCSGGARLVREQRLSPDHRRVPPQVSQDKMGSALTSTTLAALCACVCALVCA
jgi:hypothetical protein